MMMSTAAATNAGRRRLSIDMRTVFEVNYSLIQTREMLFCVSNSLRQFWKEIRIRLALLVAAIFVPTTPLHAQLASIICRKANGGGSSSSSGSLTAAAAAAAAIEDELHEKVRADIQQAHAKYLGERRRGTTVKKTEIATTAAATAASIKEEEQSVRRLLESLDLVVMQLYHAAGYAYRAAAAAGAAATTTTTIVECSNNIAAEEVGQKTTKVATV